MKFFLAFFVLSSVAFAAPSAPKKNQPISKSVTTPKKELEKNKEPNTLDKKPEDCDDKMKKPVEITPDSISLGNGTSGCSLDEAQP